MRIAYEYDEKLLLIQENPNEDDIEFHLSFFDSDIKKKIGPIQEYFNQNSITTDILIYSHPNNQLQVIVRRDFYDDFILQLFKHQLLLKLKWVY